MGGFITCVFYVGGEWTISGNCVLYAESSNIERAEAKSPNFVMIFLKILVVVACTIVAHYNPTEPLIN